MKRIFFIILTAALVLIFSGCDKNNSGNGRLVVKVTDAPFPINSIESATVTITKIEIRKAGDGISDGNPFIVLGGGEPKTFNLLELRNGVVEELIDQEIPAGEYNLVRLYIDEAGLKVKDGENFSVKIPGGQQTGIKIFINPGLLVEGGLTEELLLDFDLSNSFVLQGNMESPAGIKGFHFKPVIRAVNNTAAGRIEGSVTDAEKVVIKDARVYVELEDDTLKTFTDESGKFAFIGLQPGAYSVSAVKESYDSVIVDDVKVVAGNRTIVPFILPKE